jgi:nucleoside-diphosphate-sugar epimerase
VNIGIIGCGYVGCAIAKYWQQKMTYVVTATTTTPERVSSLENLAQKVLVVKGNEIEGLKSFVKNQDVILLTIASGRGGNYKETYLDTANTLAELLQDNSSVKQLIYTSTCSIYGDQKGALVDEDVNVLPSNANGEVIRKTEEVLLSLTSSTLKVCILRLGGIYGPSRELVKIYSRAAGTIRPGDGGEPINWIHLDDIVAGIEFARSQHLQGIYNLVDDTELKNRELIDKVSKVHNLNPVTWDSNQPSSRQYNARLSNQKIKTAGYKFIYPYIGY